MLQTTEKPPWFDFYFFISILLPHPPLSSYICLIKSPCSSQFSPQLLHTSSNLGLWERHCCCSQEQREPHTHLSAPQERTVQIKRGRINYSLNTCKETRMCGKTLPTPNVQPGVWASCLIDRPTLMTRILLAARVRRLSIKNVEKKQAPRWKK